VVSKNIATLGPQAVDGFIISVVDDSFLEDNETFFLQLVLTNPSDDSIILIDQGLSTLEIEILNNDGKTAGL
jgi:hypothetical protein